MSLGSSPVESDDKLILTVEESHKLPIAEYHEQLSHYGGPEMASSRTARGYIYFIRVQSELPTYDGLQQPIPRRYKQFALLWKAVQRQGLVIPGFVFPKATFMAAFSKEVKVRRRETFQVMLDAIARSVDVRNSNDVRAFLGVDGSVAVDHRPSMDEILAMDDAEHGEEQEERA